MKTKIEFFLKKYWKIIVVFLLALIFFIGVSSYISNFQEDDFIKWLSPDENANYVFTKLYAQTGEIRIFEKYNVIANDIIHPRSFRSDNGFLKPVSFLGIIIIYGKIASVFGYEIIPYLTPFIAALGIIFFFLLIKKIFGSRNAFISAFLLASFPPYIYFSARSMFHNVLFTVMLIIGFYFCYLSLERKYKLKREIIVPKNKWKPGIKQIFLEISALAPMAVGAYFIGLGIISRSSELIWLAPVLFVLWLFNIRKIGFTRLIIFIGFIIFAFLPVFYWNQVLYSSPINTGYPELNKSLSDIASAGTGIVKSTAVGEFGYNKELLNTIKNNIFHFGFEAGQSLRMLYHYFIDMFYYIFWFGFFGIFLFIQGIRKWKKRHFAYFSIFSIVSLILVFYYGSWEFYDNPDKESYTIGNSYTRYWLPMYLAFFPFVSMFIVRLSNALIPRYKKKQKEFFDSENKVIINKIDFLEKIKFVDRKILIAGLRSLLVFIIILLSFNFVVFGSDEGLYYSLLKQKNSKTEYDKLMEITENNSVIITRYHDKLLFPERKVIVGLFNDNIMNANYSHIASLLPLYYYNFNLPEKDIDYLNDRRLAEVSLNISEVQKITKDFTLYKLTPVVEDFLEKD
jgi:hypothetical protein